MIETIKHLFKFWKNPTNENGKKLLDLANKITMEPCRHEITVNGSAVRSLDKDRSRRKANELAKEMLRKTNNIKGKNCD